MLFSLSHGMHVVQDSAPLQPIAADSTRSRGATAVEAAQTEAGVIPIDAVVDETRGTTRGLALERAMRSATAPGAFRYLFRNAAGIPTGPQALAALDALALSLIHI